MCNIPMFCNQLQNLAAELQCIFQFEFPFICITIYLGDYIITILPLWDFYVIDCVQRVNTARRSLLHLTILETQMFC